MLETPTPAESGHAESDHAESGHSGSDNTESIVPLLEGDECAAAHGIEILAQGPAYSRLRMRIRKDMLNPHGTCHGGVIFLFADTALAYALGGAMVTTSAQIIFQTPVRHGDMLIAECTEVHRGGKAGIFDVTVTAQDGADVALLRGQTLKFGPQDQST